MQSSGGPFDPPLVKQYRLLMKVHVRWRGSGRSRRANCSYEAGASFTMRLLEERLRRAANLLAQPAGRRITDIASHVASTICPISTAASAVASTAARGR
jgi:hypothetical protein